MLVPRRVLLLPQSRLVENWCISNMIFLSNFVGNFPLNHDCGSFRVDTRTLRPHVPTVNSKGSPLQVSFYGQKKQISKDTSLETIERSTQLGWDFRN